jgi:hypothetical protein
VEAAAGARAGLDAEAAASLAGHGAAGLAAGAGSRGGAPAPAALPGAAQAPATSPFAGGHGLGHSAPGGGWQHAAGAHADALSGARAAVGAWDAGAAGPDAAEGEYGLIPAPRSAFANSDPPGEAAGGAAGGARSDWHGSAAGAGPAPAVSLASHSSGALAGAFGGPPPPEAPYTSPGKPGAAERRHSGALPAWQPAAAPAWRPPQPARNLRQYMSAEQAAGAAGHSRAGSWGQGSPAAPLQQQGTPGLWAQQGFDPARPGAELPTGLSAEPAWPAPAAAPAPAWPHDAPAWGPQPPAQPPGAAPAYAAKPYHDPAHASGLEPAAPWQPAPAQPAAEAWQSSQAPYASQQPPPPAPWPAQDAWSSAGGGAAASSDAPAHGTGSWAGSQGAAAGAERAPYARAAARAPGPWGARAALGAGPGSDAGLGGAAATAPRTADEALRTPAGRPPAAAVAWGFGGRVVLLQPGGPQVLFVLSYSLCVSRVNVQDAHHAGRAAALRRGGAAVNCAWPCAL